MSTNDCDCLMRAQLPAVGAVIAAGGEGSRMGLPMPKQFFELGGKPILIHTLEAFANSPAITTIIVVLPKDQLRRWTTLLESYQIAKLSAMVPGGTTRQESVWAGISALPADIEYVLVHDGARPFVSGHLIAACKEKAVAMGAAIAALPVTDTLKKVGGDGRIIETVSRQELWQAQTPQMARLSLLHTAYNLASMQGRTFTDEASLLEYAGFPVAVVPGEKTNIKITTKEDLAIAETILAMRKAERNNPVAGLRIGHGFDAHRLVAGRQLILGGITIPHDQGLLGHSDADVLIHALCDAILGAIGAGDLGRHFPDSDMRYKGIDSAILLDEVVVMLGRQGKQLLNIDLTVVAQRPKLAPYIGAMREKLALHCRIDQADINIKATTTEKMGFTGREEGIAAHAVVLVGP